MTWLRLAVAAAAVAAGSSPAYAASQEQSGGIAIGAILLSGLVLAILLPGFRTIVVSVGLKAALEAVLKGMLAVPGAWLVMVALDDWIGLPEGWTAYVVWAVLAAIVCFAGGRLVPAPIRRL